jgi:hypothetical protein
MNQDRLVQLVQLQARLDPELLDEHVTRPPVGLQRVGLPTTAVQREHQLRVQALAPRVQLDQPLQLGDEVGGAPAP